MIDEKNETIAERANITERSELVQEIISDGASFTEKWALALVFGVLILMLGLSWFIRYPDMIEIHATLTAKNAPKEIITRTDGHLVKIFVHNGQKIDSGATIGWMESTGNHEQIMILSKQLDSASMTLAKGQIKRIPLFININLTNLGSIQSDYQEFITAYQQFSDFMLNGFYTTKTTAIDNDITSVKRSNKILKQQQELIEADVKLAKESFNMNKILLDQKVLTKEEFRTQTSKYLNKEILIPQLNKSFLENESQIRERQKEKVQLQHDFNQENVVFSQVVNSLKSKVDDWIKANVITSPIDGQVYFTKPIQEKQYLKINEVIGYVKPVDTRIYAEGYLPQFNFGKIDTTLSVQLRFDAYPFQETGYVEGKLDYISSIPTDSGFLATIKLTNGLQTTNHKEIPYKSGLKAQAMVLTRDMRLLNRLYYNISQSISERK